jgi:MurNAc alpha-1-phosphate uridylyltransferase
MSTSAPKSAMILAAGLGRRMRPITDKTPKPLITVGGRTLLDYSLDRLVQAGVDKAIINTHHLADQIEQHVKGRKDIEIILSSETAAPLETGGGVKLALQYLGDEPFYVINGDALWLDGTRPALIRLAGRWNTDEMDALLLLHSTVEAYGYEGRGDFLADPMGQLMRRPEREVSPYLFAGVQILTPALFDDAPDGKFSLNIIYDKAIEAERLYGLVHDGDWFHIGTPDGLDQAEDYFRERYPGNRRR